MSLGTLLTIALIVALIAVIPRWNYSKRWGAAPAGLICTLLAVIVVLTMLRKF